MVVQILAYYFRTSLARRKKKCFCLFDKQLLNFRLHELAMNMPVFPSPWPKTRPQALAALISLLGPPPEGVFTKAFFPKHSYLEGPAVKPGRRERQGPLAKLTLPEKRQSLECLRTLGLDCLQWNAADRPETEFCFRTLKTAQAHSQPSKEADFVWLRFEDEELLEATSSSSQVRTSEPAAAEPAKAAEPAEVAQTLAASAHPGPDLEAEEVAAVRDTEDQDTLTYKTEPDDLDSAQVFASNFESSLGLLGQLGQHHEHHQHHQHLQRHESESLQLLVPPTARRPRWKKDSLHEEEKQPKDLAPAAEPATAPPASAAEPAAVPPASAAEPAAVPPAPNSCEGAAAGVVSPGPSKQVEEVLPWLQALPKELQLVEWLGRHGFLDKLCPCDILSLVEAQSRYMGKHNCQETLWFDFIGAWLKEPFVINLWLAVAPAPSEADAISLSDSLFKVFKSLATYHHQEVGRVLKGGRGTGFMSFFYALGLVEKKNTAPSAFDDFSLCAVIKGRRYQWTQHFGKLQALLEALAMGEPSASSTSAAAEPSHPFLDYSKRLHSRLQQASERVNLRLTNSSYVRAHLVRKLLILRLQREGAWDSFFQLGWSDFLDLQLPDEDGFVAAVPENLRNVGMIEVALSCPAIMLSCFACLAKPALKKNPNLLSSLTEAQVAKDLVDYQTLHDFNPSLERLFSWRTADEVEKRPSLSAVQDSSDESF